jgi:hypothetical protein
VAVLGQRGDRGVGDVVDVDERLRDAVDRQGDLAGDDGLAHEALAEVLVEPAAAQHGPARAGAPDELLGPLRVLLPPAGEQHQPAGAQLQREVGEGVDRLGRLGHRDVRVVREVRRARVGRPPPRRPVLRAPPTVVALVRGGAWVLPDDGEPLPLGAGDVALVRGPGHYGVADDPATPPQAVTIPGSAARPRGAGSWSG